MNTGIDYIIAHILSGEASSEDYLAFTSWLNEDEKNKKEFTLLKSYWDAEVTFSAKISPTLSLENIRKEIDRQAQQNKRKQLWKIWVPAAATIALLISLSIGFIYNKNPKVNEYFTYLTNDNKTSFTLSDGTEITLNKNSSLTYTNAFGIENRYVKLQGEAYFEVKRDINNPFKVAMPVGDTDAAIKVLGTIFNVSINAEEEKITATLVEGSIEFHTPHQKILMTPNQQLVYTYSTDNIQISDVNAEEEILWKQGLIRYRRTTFVDLVAELEKKYKVQIVLQNNKLKNPYMTVTGSFVEEQSLEQILEIVSRSLPIKWSKKENIYYIK